MFLGSRLFVRFAECIAVGIGRGCLTRGTGEAIAGKKQKMVSQKSGRLCETTVEECGWQRRRGKLPRAVHEDKRRRLRSRFEWPEGLGENSWNSSDSILAIGHLPVTRRRLGIPTAGWF